MDLKRVNPDEAKRLIDDEGYLALDVRSIPEHEEIRVPGSYNVPFLHKTPQGMVPNADFQSAVEAIVPDKSKGMVVYDASGGRSLRATRELIQLGYDHAVDLRGGIAGERDDDGQIRNPGWAGEGLPTESGPDGARGYATLVRSTGIEADLPEAEPLPPLTGDPMNRFASEKHRVRCVRYKRELPGLKRRPYPGPLGQRLFEEVSALAWNEWVEHSKMIINEYRIVSTDPKAMALLYEQCESFFYGGGVDRPAEYVPE